jgi:VanZ family protein
LQKKALNYERRGRFSAFAPLVLWVAVILILGSGQGSMAQTSRFIKPLIEFFFPDADPQTFLLVHSLIRKAAHFVEYGILAFLAARAFSTSPGKRARGLRGAWAMALVLATACTDEIVQSFDLTRTGSGWDVLLDAAGGFAGLLLFLFVNPRR